MRRLELFEEYDRKDVHDIFDPSGHFTPQAGTWGLHGIVRLPNSLKDFVFFVTFGQSQGDHDFDEGVTEDGILTWQSQPRMKLQDDTIQTFINHDHHKHNIFLFLRTRRLDAQTKKAEPFTYLGRLAYVTHDIEREQPVHFKWQLLDWEVNESVFERMNLKLQGAEPISETAAPVKNQLIFTDPPALRNREKGTTTSEFKARKVDFAESQDKNKKLGLAGELLVLEKEKEYLIENGRPDLAEKVQHTSQMLGDGAGYDILSFTLEGQEKYIEVKTTTGGLGTPFYITENEINFSTKYCAQYCLYRLYNFDKKSSNSCAFIINGNLSERLRLTATQFRASLY